MHPDRRTLQHGYPNCHEFFFDRCSWCDIPRLLLVYKVKLWVLGDGWGLYGCSCRAALSQLQTLHLARRAFGQVLNKIYLARRFEFSQELGAVCE